MSKHLLLLVQDNLLAESYASLLQQAGFTPLRCQCPSELLPLLPPTGTTPTGLLVDPVFFHPSQLNPSLSKALQTLAQSNIPALGLPTPLEFLARSGLKLSVQTSSSQAPTLKALSEALVPLQHPAIPQTAGPLRENIQNALPERLRLLRKALRSASTLPPPPDSLRDLFLETHAFALLAGMTEGRLLFQLAKALLQAVHELFQPAAPSQSPFRTLAQGLDLVSTLLEGAPERIHPPRVLVVEDDPNANHLVCAAMSIVELDPVPALDAEQALQLAQSNPPDVVLLDIGLPSISGLEFCGRLRNLPQHQNTPVVFLTGMTDLSHRLQSNLTGGNDFVCKPFNLHEIGLKALIWALKRPPH